MCAPHLKYALTHGCVFSGKSEEDPSQQGSWSFQVQIYNWSPQLMWIEVLICFILRFSASKCWRISHDSTVIYCIFTVTAPLKVALSDIQTTSKMGPSWIWETLVGETRRTCRSGLRAPQSMTGWQRKRYKLREYRMHIWTTRFPVYSKGL